MRGSWRLNKDCNILTPTLMAISVVSFSFSRAAQPEARWLSFLLGFSTTLVSNSSGPQLSDFLSSPSYIIVQSPTQSPTQSLEWHVWSSSSGNNCHAVHRSLSSGASIYECIMGFLPCPIFSAKPPTQFLLITAIGMCHFLPVHHFGMACLAGSKVNIQHKETEVTLLFYLNLKEHTVERVFPIDVYLYYDTTPSL